MLPSLAFHKALEFGTLTSNMLPSLAFHKALEFGTLTSNMLPSLAFHKALEFGTLIPSLKSSSSRNQAGRRRAGFTLSHLRSSTLVRVSSLTQRRAPPSRSRSSDE